MSKTFRPWKIDEPLLLPPVVQEFVAKDHLARLVLSLVREDIDLAAISGSYAGERGQPPFDPVMMTALLLYSYCCGIYSSRRIAKACRERVDFMSIVGSDAPDCHTISEFRRRHLEALSALFTQILHLCETAGLVKLGHVALDGTKIKANASKHKAMSYERMEKRAAELEAEVAKWLEAAEATDAEEDKRCGADKTGEEMPDWIADKKQRAERIRQAKAELEAEAKAAAEAKLKSAAEAQQQRDAGADRGLCELYRAHIVLIEGDSRRQRHRAHAVGVDDIGMLSADTAVVVQDARCAQRRHRVDHARAADAGGLALADSLNCEPAGFDRYVLDRAFRPRVGVVQRGTVSMWQRRRSDLTSAGRLTLKHLVRALPEIHAATGRRRRSMSIPATVGD